MNYNRCIAICCRIQRDSMMADSRNSIWVGSGDEYASWLKRHYKDLIRSQKARLKQCQGYVERCECEEEIARLKSELKQKLRDRRDVV